MRIQPVVDRLNLRSDECIGKALLELRLHNNPEATNQLSFATSYRFYANFFSNPDMKINSVVDKTINDILKIIDSTKSKDSVCKRVIHNYTPDEAYNLLLQICNPSVDNDFFWIGYFNAEYWDNKSALGIFDRLAESRKNAVDYHWKGNLLSKLKRFEEALQPLLLAANMEPERYNHFSHLGDVYRGLKRNDEAMKYYKKAIMLIKEKNDMGRVEIIHLVRCYHGISATGLKEYRALSDSETKLGIESGLVKGFELERIKH